MGEFRRTFKSVRTDGLSAADDGSPEFADGKAELHRFFRDYFGNGDLMIFNAETEALLSRCDPFIPLNMMANPEGSNRDIAEWRAKALERRKAIDSAPKGCFW